LRTQSILRSLESALLVQTTTKKARRFRIRLNIAQTGEP